MKLSELLLRTACCQGFNLPFNFVFFFIQVLHLYWTGSIIAMVAALMHSLMFILWLEFPPGGKRGPMV